MTSVAQDPGSGPGVAPALPADPGGTPRAGFGPVLALAATLAIAAAITLTAIALLVVHPDRSGLGPLAATLVNQQNQSAKTALYVLGFLVIAPLAFLTALRLADRVPAAATLCAALVAWLGVVLIAARVATGGGLRPVLAGMAVWWIGTAAMLIAARRGRPAALLTPLTPAAATVAPAIAAVSMLGVLLCLTGSRSLGVLPLAIGAAVAIAVLLGAERIRRPRPRRLRWLFDVVLVVVVALAIPDLVVFRTTAALPNVYFDPGVVQFQHDWILGSANQLLGGGALLVNVPVSQYGVGLIWFLYAWFHLVPIGYGTFGFLDGILTALFYVAAYATLRVAGVTRLLAGAAIVLGVLAFVDNFQYFVGQLPEEGPLRFGLPLLVILGEVARARAVRRPAPAPTPKPPPTPSHRPSPLALLALGVSAVWALEAFAYTAFTYAAITAVRAWLAPPGRRRRTAVTAAAPGVGAAVAAHVVLALATLAGTGELPHWGQYLGYVHEFLFGGAAGSISYGFADWSPGLAVYAAALVSALAIVALVLRAPHTARRDPARLIGLAGCTAYAIALLSYTDNRSSTYLFLYVAIPVLMAAVLWLSMTRDARTPLTSGVRRAVLGAALTLAVLLFAGAWPAIGGHLSRSLLAHAYPGGGARAALHRLWHPPPIDPRAPAGERLLARYMAPRRDLVLLPTLSDLGLEILMRSHRANALPIGDPKADSLVPSVWLPIMRRAVPRLHAGQRIIVDAAGLRVVAAMRRDPRIDPVTARVDGAQPELAWILDQLTRRFRFQRIAGDPAGLIVALLVNR